MKILIELPTWLGDTVMATPAIENLVNHFKNVEITLLGSLVSIAVLKNHPKVLKTYVLEKKYIYLYKTLKNFDEFDVFFSFRSSLRSKFIKFYISSKSKYQFDNKKYINDHQVEKYNNFINDSLNINSFASKLILNAKDKNTDRKNKLLGINPGATYGNSKRWYPRKFADVAMDLSNVYDIIIFGGPEEKDIAADIERHLIENGVKNYQNLAAKTSITELIKKIANLDLFVTGDSGPMHLAAAFQVPTVTIFGPTNDKETSQWMNEKSMVVKKNLGCQPCMKRSCPLKHHNCMKQVQASDVLEAVKRLI
ncbi:lipopolysaccharide heptosyltransferase II [Candidatus Pseudothioglobus singularis]|nr:lipopolysaccharide heptosyltransferase II [Candidatus Pseudothioglobus singularis]